LLNLFTAQAENKDYSKYMSVKVKESLRLIETKASVILPSPEGDKSVEMPQWQKSYDIALSEAKEADNPIAAFIAMYALKTIWGEQRKPEDYELLAKTLYAHSLCEGYVSYGKVFESGIVENKNLTKAKEIYEEGLKKCKVSFYPDVLNSAIARVEWAQKRGVK